MNKIYKIGDDIEEWYIATNKEQLVKYYHKEYGEDLSIEDIEEANLTDGYWNGSAVTEKDIQEFLDSMQEDFCDKDEVYYPQEQDKCGDIRYHDGEYWKWETFEETLKEYKKDVIEPEKICSTEY